MIHAEKWDKYFSYIDVDTATEALQPLTRGVHDNGKKVLPRRIPCYEVLHHTTVIRLPNFRLVLFPGRCLNPFFLVAEAFWILSGAADAEYILQFNKRLAQFLDGDSKYFHGAYGERIRRYFHHAKSAWAPMRPIDQVAEVIEKLRQDPASRRAVITLWNPALDYKTSNDIPCNDTVFFKLRDHELDITVCNRSNDVVLGFPVTNLFQFSMLQEMVASLLCVEVGRYVQHSDSLHYYVGDPIGERILNVELPEWYVHQGVGLRKLCGARLDDYDRYFANLRDLCAGFTHEEVEGRFVEGVARDYAHFLHSFLNYRAKDYLKASEALRRVESFDLLLSGYEFYIRAIKDESANEMFRAECLRKLPASAHDDSTNSIWYFIEGWRDNDK